jgi:hypothetical protein
MDQPCLCARLARRDILLHQRQCRGPLLRGVVLVSSRRLVHHKQLWILKDHFERLERRNSIGALRSIRNFHAIRYRYGLRELPDRFSVEQNSPGQNHALERGSAGMREQPCQLIAHSRTSG